MEGIREPVGDLPPEVYWRRRAIVIGTTVLAIVVMWFLFTSPSGDDPDDQATPSVTPDTTPPPTSTPESQISRPCTEDDVAITLVADPADFPAGSLPTFEAEFAHTGDSPCALDTSSDDSDLFIRSGSDEIFYASHCPETSPINSRQYILADGATEQFQVSWNRERSAEDCGTVSAEPLPGTYRATLTIQGISSEEAVFRLGD